MSPTPLRIRTKGKIDTPNLPSDCIEEILKSLDKENDFTLGYCWCQVAILLL